MKAVEQQKAAKQFAEDWLGRGDEKQDTQAFWLSLEFLEIPLPKLIQNQAA